MTCTICTALRERGETRKCYRCLMRRIDTKCASCGSPWFYLIADGSFYEDGEERPLCKPCTFTLIVKENLNDMTGLNVS